MQHILVARRDLAADRPAPALKLPRDLDAQLRSLGSVQGVGADAHRRVYAFELECDVAVQSLPADDREPEQPAQQVVAGSTVVPRSTRSSPRRSREMDSGCRRKFLGLPWAGASDGF
jgi:hypothetical protein